MSDKERLKEIKNRHQFPGHLLGGGLTTLLEDEDVDWLIQQAERVVKAGEGFFGRMAARLLKERNRLKEENARLREALDWIEQQAAEDEYGAQDRVLKAISETHRALERHDQP